MTNRVRVRDKANRFIGFFDDEEQASSFIHRYDPLGKKGYYFS